MPARLARDLALHPHLHHAVMFSVFSAASGKVAVSTGRCDKQRLAQE